MLQLGKRSARRTGELLSYHRLEMAADRASDNVQVVNQCNALEVMHVIAAVGRCDPYGCCVRNRPDKDLFRLRVRKFVAARVKHALQLVFICAA